MDELETITLYLETKGLQVVISDDSHVYDSLGELARVRGTRPSQFRIEAERRREHYSSDIAALRFDGSRVVLTSDSTNEGRSIAYEIKEILLRGKSGLYLALSPWLWWYLTLAIFFVASIVGAVGDLTEQPTEQLAFGLLTASGISLLMTIFCAGFRAIAFQPTLVRRHEGRFIERYGDKVLPAAIAALVSGLVTWTLTRLLSGESPTP